jgi:hypothetical protein
MKYYIPFFCLFFSTTLFSQFEIGSSIQFNNKLNYSEFYKFDINGDSYIDLVVISYNRHKIIWFENLDGKGNFSEQKLIASSVMFCSSIDSWDIDSDGDNDIVVTPQGDWKIIWFENINGDGSFWKENIIVSYTSNPIKVIAADVDGDNDKDIIYSGWKPNRISLLINTNGRGNFGEEITIANFGEESLNDFFIVDIDNDMDYDLIAHCKNEIIVFENDNINGLFSERKKLYQSEEYISQIKTEDFDNDGDVDLFLLYRKYADNRKFHLSKITLLENTNGIMEVLNQEIIRSENYIHDFTLSDIDSDGYKDILISTNEKDLWNYKNFYGSGSFINNGKIVENFDILRNICTVDIDSDGDNDIYALSNTWNKIHFLRNSKYDINDQIYNKPDGVIVVQNITQDLFDLYFDDHNVTGYYVTDITGKIIESKKLKTENQISVDLSKYKKGIYLIKLLTLTGVYSKNIIQE